MFSCARRRAVPGGTPLLKCSFVAFLSPLGEGGITGRRGVVPYGAHLPPCTPFCIMNYAFCIIMP